MMNNNQTPKITANTLGNIAKLYGVGVTVLNGWLNEYPTLYTEITAHIGKACKNKNAKLLPPILIEKIYTTLGTP